MLTGLEPDQMELIQKKEGLTALPANLSPKLTALDLSENALEVGEGTGLRGSQHALPSAFHAAGH